jgi:hypothetical protein
MESRNLASMSQKAREEDSRAFFIYFSPSILPTGASPAYPKRILFHKTEFIL